MDLWKTPLYAHERMRVKKVNNVLTVIKPILAPLSHTVPGCDEGKCSLSHKTQSKEPRHVMLKRSELLVAFRGRFLKMRETVAGYVTTWLVWGLQASGQLTVNFLVVEQLVEQRTGGSEQWQSINCWFDSGSKDFL